MLNQTPSSSTAAKALTTASAAGLMTSLRILSGQHAGVSINWADDEQSPFTLGCDEDLDVYIGDWTAPAVTLRSLPGGQWEARWAAADGDEADAGVGPGDGLPAAAQRDGPHWLLPLEPWMPVRFGPVIWCLGPSDQAWPDDASLLQRHFTPPAPAWVEPELEFDADPLPEAETQWMAEADSAQHPAASAELGEACQPAWAEGADAFLGSAPAGRPAAAGRRPRNRTMIASAVASVSLLATFTLGSSLLWTERTAQASAPDVATAEVAAVAPAPTAAERLRAALVGARLAGLSVATEGGTLVVWGVLPSRSALVATDAALEPLRAELVWVRRYVAAEDVVDMVRAVVAGSQLTVVHRGAGSFAVSGLSKDMARVRGSLARLQADLAPVGATLELAWQDAPPVGLSRVSGAFTGPDGSLVARQPGGVKYIVAGEPAPSAP